jgi:hypothetical protein
MNQLHRRWNIDNEDFLYVLSTFVFEPTRWHQQYGWRTPSEIEKRANFYFWREVGRRMNIQEHSRHDGGIRSLQHRPRRQTLPLSSSQRSNLGRRR